METNRTKTEKNEASTLRKLLHKAGRWTLATVLTVLMMVCFLALADEGPGQTMAVFATIKGVAAASLLLTAALWRVCDRNGWLPAPPRLDEEM